MPSLRKRVSSYLRQLSFYRESEERCVRDSIIDGNTLVDRYLRGQLRPKEDAPPIVHAKALAELPEYQLAPYGVGSSSVVARHSGPDGGLAAVPRPERHLSLDDRDDIQFIDVQEELVTPDAFREPRPLQKGFPAPGPVDNSTMVIRVAGQEYAVTDRKKRQASKTGSTPPLNMTADHVDNNNDRRVECKNGMRNVAQRRRESDASQQPAARRNGDPNDRLAETNYRLAKSKSEGDPFQRRKRGKIIKIADRSIIDGTRNTLSNFSDVWDCKTDHAYGVSGSLYDLNQITKSKNGDPIADCFGIIARNDSAILAVADGVNWGEKASIAAKSAVHGCLHYLSKTVFDDAETFQDPEAATQTDPPTFRHSKMTGTKDVFVCLLRAFNCAHDLILENGGMLTTLTVAVVLPLDSQASKLAQCGESRESYVCCVCNVGDTLAYVYSHKYGIRELTKGSHDVSCNRDMRDALGALGPVDGINPELSNLTLSLTIVQKGDIILVASDGLTDNFDPDVCKFTVNKTRDKGQFLKTELDKKLETPRNVENLPVTIVPRGIRPPAKPPRKNKNLAATPKSRSERTQDSDTTTSSNSHTTCDQLEANIQDPLIAQFIRKNTPSETPRTTDVSGMPSSVKKKSDSLDKSTTPVRAIPRSSRPETTKIFRSKTSVDIRRAPPGKNSVNRMLRNQDGVPFVTPLQRYEISLLLMEDVLKHGISGRDVQCTTAKRACENLVDFAYKISSAKRRALEDLHLYYDDVNGVLIEISPQQKKIRRKKGLEKTQNLAGKLDHVSVVAYNVGNFATLF